MIIEKAVIDDLEEIMKFYDMMCIELGKADFLPSGNKGGFPSEEMLKDSIFSENLFVGRENGIIMAAYIMNNTSDPAYKNINWQTDAPDSKVSILHALRVSPLYAGRGCASALLKQSKIRLRLNLSRIIFLIKTPSFLQDKLQVHQF